MTDLEFDRELDRRLSKISDDFGEIDVKYKKKRKGKTICIQRAQIPKLLLVELITFGQTSAIWLE